MKPQLKPDDLIANLNLHLRNPNDISLARVKKMSLEMRKEDISLSWFVDGIIAGYEGNFVDYDAIYSKIESFKKANGELVVGTYANLSIFYVSGMKFEKALDLGNSFSIDKTDIPSIKKKSMLFAILGM